MTRLSSLVEGLDAAIGQDADLGQNVTGFAIDNRKVAPGTIFGAFQGLRVNGEDFVADAVKAGAIAVVARPEATVEGAIHIAHANPRRLFAQLAARYFAPFPDATVAVTGTNGKTSTVELTRQLWRMMGHHAASIGTLGVTTSVDQVSTGLTTPDIVTFLSNMSGLRREGVTHAAFEASSHGLAQYRTEGLPVMAGGFTNLSRDHMDYHPTVEHYLGAKLRLFSDLVTDGGAAVVAADHEHSEAVCAAARQRGLRLIAVGRAGDGIRLADARVDGFAQVLTLAHEGKMYQVRLPLVGDFQIENALVAAGLAIATGGAADAVFASLEHLEGAKGRLELVGERNGAPVFVDYAHKPDALEKALAALRPYAKRKLVVVFGAGGDRDAGKRPLMGEIAAHGADHVIVTDDNPRSENPAAIRAAIVAAASGAHEIGDRAEAIRVAVEGLQAGDALLIAGKGHETGQIVGDKVLPFSDHDAARAALSSRVV